MLAGSDMAQQSEAAPLILRRRQVEARVGLKKTALYERIANREFPAPVSLGGHAVGWVASEVDAWVAERIAQSRSGEANV
jgi:prophage regulatory protein